MDRHLPSPAARHLALEEAGPARTQRAVVDALAAVTVGLVVHRRGPDRPTDLDERWRLALADVAGDCGLTSLGTVVRTESGTLLRTDPTGRGWAA